MQNRLLRHADFKRLWAADALSQAGTQVTAIALPLLLIKVLDAGPFEVGLLTTFEFLAFLLVGLPAGVWVDRMRRRNVLMVADLVRGLLYGSLPLAWALDALTLVQVYAVALVAGVCTVFFDVAYQSYLPHLVGPPPIGWNDVRSPRHAPLVVRQASGPPETGWQVTRH